MSIYRATTLTKTNGPVNAIEHVIIPRTENTIKCKLAPFALEILQVNMAIDINSELDELDREEFYRLEESVKQETTRSSRRR